jgi:adenylate kinase
MLLMGAPGAGKGTQALRIAATLGVPAISTGDIFRSSIAANTKLGQLAKGHLEAGEYVPDSLTNDLVRARLQDDDAAEGWLLDGYPRTLAQVHELDDIACATGGSLQIVVALEVGEGELVHRLRRRAVEQGRPDDTEEVIWRRQTVYREQTEPLLRVYQERGLLRIVDGGGDVESVTERMRAQLDLLERGPR